MQIYNDCSIENTGLKVSSAEKARVLRSYEKSGNSPTAVVYHKRRKTLRQLCNSCLIRPLRWGKTMESECRLFQLPLVAEPSFAGIIRCQESVSHLVAGRTIASVASDRRTSHLVCARCTDEANSPLVPGRSIRAL